MISLVLAAALALQETPPTEPVEAELEDVTAPAQAPGEVPVLIDAPQDEDGDPDAEAPAPPPPLPTDAATLTQQILGAWSSYADLEAELAARSERERYLTSLILPVLSRQDLDAGAHAEILAALGPVIAETEAANTQWAIDQLDPEYFVILWAERPRTASAILRWAERSTDSETAIVAALRPVAEAGLTNGAEYAVRADAAAIAQNGRQFYGTEEVCVDGLRELVDLRQRGRVDERRLAIGLAPLEEDWAARLEAGGESCEISPSPETPETASEPPTE